MSKGWHRESIRHSLASKGIETVSSRGSAKNLEEGEYVSIDDALQYVIKNYNPERELSVTLSSTGQVYSIQEGESHAVTTEFVGGEKEQVSIHTHPTDRPPSMTDLFGEITAPEIGLSYVVTSNYIYKYYQKEDIPDELAKSEEAFVNGFRMAVDENYPELSNKYDSLSTKEKIPIYLTWINDLLGSFIELEVMKR